MLRRDEARIARHGPFVTPELGATGVRTIGDRVFDFSRRVAVMAIINNTPDSFYDKGRTYGFEAALAAVEAAVDAGADWLDIGGVPFSPLTPDVPEQEELRRVLPVVTAARKLTDAVISVDTYRAGVAAAAVDAGATAVNDTSGLHDPGMAGVVARTGATLVLTHSKAAPRTWLERPSYEDVVGEVAAYLRRLVSTALDAGVAPSQLVVDPGHDLNKNTVHSLELTRRLGELALLGHPLLVSVSNKDFIQESLGGEPAAVTDGTLAALAYCVTNGARIVRVHDVRRAVNAVRMVETIAGWRDPEYLVHNM